MILLLLDLFKAIDTYIICQKHWDRFIQQILTHYKTILFPHELLSEIFSRKQRPIYMESQKGFSIIPD
jgi:hypothetical protein